MQLSPYAYLAWTLAEERQREVARHYQFAEALAAARRGPGAARRAAARVAAGLSRASAAIARRLDSGSLDRDAIESRSTFA